MFKALLAGVAVLAALAAAPAEARTDKIKVHGASLEGNLEGNSPDRDVYVFLPPSYDASANKRYPVVYFLHGYSVGADAYDGLAKFQEAVDQAAAAGNEVIVVMPDVLTKFKGAMFGASVTTGDFERYVAQDLVGYIDTNYRTLKIAMKYPGIFSSIYAMAPCCLSPSNMTAEQIGQFTAMTPEQVATAQGFGLATPATLSAWAPDPKNPPYYVS